MSDPVVAMPAVRSRRNLARSILVALVLAPVLAVGSPAGAETLSEGCTGANFSVFDQQILSGAIVGSSFLAGETLTATAGHPAEAHVESISLTLNGEIVDTAPLPGTVSYTFPADTFVQELRWASVPLGDVTWTVECGPGPTTKDQCKDGGWEAFGFKNQGQCLRFVATKK